jgi:ribosomal RNA-processing protein 7
MKRRKGSMGAEEQRSVKSSHAWSALPFRLYTEDGPVRHMFLKHHETNEFADDHQSSPAEGSNQRVFLASIPTGISEEEFLRFLVKTAGQVDQIAMHGSRTSALVKFESDKSVEKLFNACRQDHVKSQSKRSSVKILRRVPRTDAFGLKSWVNEHKSHFNKNTNAVLQKHLDEWMDAFEEREAREKEEALQALEEDGWTVVRRFKGRKKNSNEPDGITVGAIAPAAARDIANRASEKVAKRSEGQGGDFYRTNTREKRRSELINLRERFEEDRKRLMRLRNARKFNPGD